VGATHATIKKGKNEEGPGPASGGPIRNCTEVKERLKKGLIPLRTGLERSRHLQFPAEKERKNWKNARARPQTSPL